jgi:hypothetical protein
MFVEEKNAGKMTIIPGFEEKLVFMCNTLEILFVITLTMQKCNCQNS